MPPADEKAREHIRGTVHHTLALIGEIVDQNADHKSFFLPLGLEVRVDLRVALD